MMSAACCKSDPLVWPSKATLQSPAVVRPLALLRCLSETSQFLISLGMQMWGNTVASVGGAHRHVDYITACAGPMIRSSEDGRPYRALVEIDILLVSPCRQIVESVPCDCEQRLQIAFRVIEPFRRCTPPGPEVAQQTPMRPYIA